MYLLQKNEDELLNCSRLAPALISVVLISLEERRKEKINQALNIVEFLLMGPVVYLEMSVFVFMG